MIAAKLTDAGATGVPASLLIVEDEVLIRIDLAEEFRAAGFTVYDAANGDEALSILNAMPDIRLVISDVRMPGATDGIALAHWLRQHRPGIAVVLVSGHSSTAEMSAAAPDLILQKPVNPTRLVKKVHELLAAPADERRQR